MERKEIALLAFGFFLCAASIVLGFVLADDGGDSLALLGLILLTRFWAGVISVFRKPPA